jgi:hypothetical protein
MKRLGTLGMASLLFLCTQTPVAATESAAEKMERLERQLDELRQEIQELKRQQAQGAPSAPAPAAPPAPAAAAAPAEPAAQATAQAPSLGEAAKGLLERVQIGGYGSTRFEANSATNENTTFTLRRLVLTGDAAIAPRLRSYFELEFERFRELELERTVTTENGGLVVEQAVEGTNESEIELEQAWLEFELVEQARIRTGAVLVPLGRFNLNHDDNRWDIARRPLIDRGAPVLPAPSAWDELGAGLTGDVAIGEHGTVGYQLYVVNGALLEPEVESELEAINEEGSKELKIEAEFSPSTGTFSKDLKDSKAVTGRVVYSPALGQEIAGSFYTGRYTPDFLPSENITSAGADGLSIWGPIELEGEYLYSDFGDVSELARGFATRAVADEVALSNSEFEAVMEFALDSLADIKQGYWLEGRYRFRPNWLKQSIFGRYFEDPVLTAVVRGEQVWYNGLLQELSFSAGQVTSLEKDNRRIDRITIGGSYRPVPLVVFQLAYEFTEVNKGSLSEVTNYLDTSDDKAHALLVGAAFGF